MRDGCRSGRKEGPKGDVKIQICYLFTFIDASNVNLIQGPDT